MSIGKYFSNLLTPPPRINPPQNSSSPSKDLNFKCLSRWRDSLLMPSDDRKKQWTSCDQVLSELTKTALGHQVTADIKLTTPNRSFYLQTNSMDHSLSHSTVITRLACSHGVVDIANKHATPEQMVENQFKQCFNTIQTFTLKEE